MFGSIPFIPGRAAPESAPLSHYLPRVNEGVISAWLKVNAAPGSWTLDPFGASPRIAIEAAQSGYRVLVTANNPIIRFLIELMANPPQSEELKSSLAELSASYVGNERTEPHIDSLYQTYCARCGQEIYADFFGWEQGNPSPYLRSYTCPNCGDSGEHPCTPSDTELAHKFSTSGLHRARALERVVTSTDQDRTHVEQALSVYTPRAIYALITLINKIDGLKISPKGEKCLRALLLFAFDQANAMWKYPPQKERRRLLVIPRHYREINIWSALEQGVKIWSNTASSEGLSPEIPVTTWPELPPISGGICIYEGRFINIAKSLQNIHFESACSALPRPNQAFWTLSALWSGWLWSRDAVGSFKSVLHRQRYDWAWHTSALSSVFKQLSNAIAPSTPILGLITEAEPGFIGSALVAALAAGCSLESMAIRPNEGQAQIIWKIARNQEINQVGSSVTQSAIQYASIYLEERAEPASYMNTICAAFMGILHSLSSEQRSAQDEKNLARESPQKSSSAVDITEPTPSLLYTSIYNAAREALSYRCGFLRYNIQEIPSIDSEAKSQIIQTSLFDLVEPVIDAENEEPENIELPPSAGESSPGKERPTRSSDVSESTLIWLREPGELSPIALTDNYEINLVNFLVGHPGSTIQEIDLALCAIYPGLFTPDLEFINLCLESYAVADPINPHQWYIRPEDDPKERELDIDQAKQFIRQIGARIGFLCEDRRDRSSKSYVCWEDKETNQEYRFFPTITAAIGENVLFGEQPPDRGFIVIPGSRANLHVYKMRRDPRFSRAFNPVQGNWQLLKFRHLRSLAESPSLNRDNIDQLLSIDPITYSTPQIRLL